MTIARWEGDASQADRVCGPPHRAHTAITGSSGHQLCLPILSWLPILLFIHPPSCSCPHFPEKEMRAKGAVPMQEDWALCSFTGKRNLDQPRRRLHFKTLI